MFKNFARYSKEFSLIKGVRIFHYKFIPGCFVSILFNTCSKKKIKKVKEINRNLEGQGMIYTSRYYNLNNIVSITYNKSHNRIMKKKRKLSMLPEEVNMNTKNLK